MSKYTDHRVAVADCLKHLGKTRYWLAQQLKSTISMSSLYGYLNKDRDLSLDKMQAINKVLGLRYTDE